MCVLEESVCSSLVSQADSKSVRWSFSSFVFCIHHTHRPYSRVGSNRPAQLWFELVASGSHSNLYSAHKTAHAACAGFRQSQQHRKQYGLINTWLLVAESTWKTFSNVSANIYFFSYLYRLLLLGYQLIDDQCRTYTGGIWSSISLPCHYVSGMPAQLNGAQPYSSWQGSYTLYQTIHLNDICFKSVRP